MEGAVGENVRETEASKPNKANEDAGAEGARSARSARREQRERYAKTDARAVYVAHRDRCVPLRSRL
jgi:hypothetical protein